MTLSWLIYPLAEKYSGRNVRPKLKNLREWMKKPDSERRTMSLQKLHCILTWANETVPYYRDLFQQVNFKPDLVLRSSEELLKIPYTTKDILREQGSRMLSEKVDPSNLHNRKTNGSTGISTDIFYDTESLDWAAATNLLTYDYTGRSMSHREVHLSSLNTDLQLLKDVWAERFRCFAMGRTNLYTSSFSEDDLGKLLAEITKVAPYQIQGHPSTLYHLSQYARVHGLDRYPLFRTFESTGETLNPEKVRAIEETFGCKVYNRYGNAEFGVMAHSAENSELLEIFDFNVWIENRILTTGQKELIGTGLLNRAMPLIRYQTGDIGELSVLDRKPILSKLEGRLHDLVSIRGQMHPTHYFKDLLERWGGIDEWQVILQNTKPHRLRIVGNSTVDQASIRQKATEAFGNEYEVEFITLGELKFTGWRDKFRYVVKEAEYPTL